MSANLPFGFLEEVIDRIISDYPNSTSQLCIVTPNRRAQVFIKNYIQEKGISMMLPSLFSIDDFIHYLSPYTVFDNVDLCFELYIAYKDLEGEEAQSFELFMQWAAVLINDFNEIDMHLGDANAIFSYLSEDYALREWNLNRQDLSDFQKKYLAFFHKLNDYYQLFSQRLLSQNAAYTGLEYRYVAENIHELVKEQSWKKIIFAGFNALTLSEEKIVRSLYESKSADIFWDVDDYTFSNTSQEAGLFLRKYAKWFDFGAVKISEYFKQKKEIQIIAVPKAVAQAKIAAELLEKQLKSGGSKKDALAKTALVLADEDLLMPVLNSLEKEVLAETNVTMGYPLKNTSAHILFRVFLKMQFSAARNQKMGSQFLMRFSNEDVLQILHNPIIADFLGNYSECIPEIRKQLYWSTEELKVLFADMACDHLSFLFISFENSAEQAIHFFQLFIERFTEAFLKSNDDLQLAYSSDWEAFMLYGRLLNRLEDRIEKYGFPYNLQEFKIVFEQLIGNQSQAFHGEPLKGLQLMGLLETRVLDFENLILLSVNEDILPSGRMSNSFIPVDIKRTFNLPTYKEKNAIFAYHFYRLLQRAKNVHLLYSNSSGNLQGGEESRFITQLKLELIEYFPQSIIEEKRYDFKEIKPGNRIEIRVEKEESILKRLDEIAEKGFSPTALNTYINCSLKFYFSKVMKIPEPEQEDNYIDDRMLGNIIHHTLENLFFPFIDKSIAIEDLKVMKAKMPVEVMECAKKEARGQILDSGQNLLTLKGIEKYLDRYFEEEVVSHSKNIKSGGSWRINGLEEKLERSINLPSRNQDIKLFGFVDRLDSWNGTHRVLDYKTGAVSATSLKNIDFKELFHDSKYDKSVQLLSYAWLLNNRYPNKDLQSGIIAIRNTNDPYVFLGGSDQKKISEEELSLFEQELLQFLEGLFNPNIPFTQTEEKKNCQYCPYMNICLK